MTSPFGKNCPHPGCTEKIVRATGDLDSAKFNVRCEAGHRSKATRSRGGKLTLTPKEDDG